MRELGDLLAKLDVIVSLATSAKSSKKEFVRPEILEKGTPFKRLQVYIFIFILY